jgi:dolichyl-phosphate-mannose-protein mannosyltransferase
VLNVQPEQPNEQPKEQPEGVKGDDSVDEAIVSAPPQDAPQDLHVVSKEERVEYRDEKGRVLDDAEVEALKGKVSFKTRYETRTRLVDAEGNEVFEDLVESHDEAEEHGVAPPHPDVEGRNPETQEQAEAVEPSEAPPTVAAEDQQKENMAEQRQEEAQPASEAQTATQQAE